jgi:hypothetical protein
MVTVAAPPADRANEYHDLQLQVDKPGTTVRTTTGYYANTQRECPLWIALLNGGYCP